VICEKPITTRLSDADRVIDACKTRSTLLAVNHLRWWHPLWYSVRDEIEEGAIGRISHLAIHWPSGRLGCFGTHMFDAASLLLDSSPDAVSGALDSFVPPDCRGPEFHDPGGRGIVRFDNGVDEIVTCLTGGRDVSSAGENARDALEVIIAFHVSSRLGGQWLSLPLEGQARDMEVRMG